MLVVSRSFNHFRQTTLGICAIVTFVLTVSFLFSTPGAFQFPHGLLVLGDAGQFLIKDLVLLGVSIWTAGEARKGD
jgi:reactive chlorine resistance protein C